MRWDRMEVSGYQQAFRRSGRMGNKTNYELTQHEGRMQEMLQMRSHGFSGSATGAARE